MTKKTDAEVAKSLYDRATKMTVQKEIIEDLQTKLKLRDKLIDEQRLRIKLLQIELNRKKWWKLW